RIAGVRVAAEQVVVRRGPRPGGSRAIAVRAARFDDDLDVVRADRHDVAVSKGHRIGYRNLPAVDDGPVRAAVRQKIGAALQRNLVMMPRDDLFRVRQYPVVARQPADRSASLEYARRVRAQSRALMTRDSKRNR